MSAKRGVLISAGLAAGVVLLVFGAALAPPVQTFAARHLLASAAGPGSRLSSIDAGFNQITVTALRLESEHILLEVPTAEADLGVLEACLGRGIHVRRLVAKGWTLDFTLERPPAPQRPAASGPPGAPWVARAAGSILAAFNVPSDLLVDGVDLEGTVLFPDDSGKPRGRARVSITGGGLAADRNGRFLCRASAVLNDPSAPVSGLDVKGTLSAAMDAAGTFTRADIKMDATARGQKFPNGVVLVTEASAARETGSELYTLSIDRGSERVAFLVARNADGSHRVTGDWRLNVQDSDLAPFVLGRRLPTFKVAGEGGYDFDALTRDIRASGQFKASADRLGIVAPGLAALGALDADADFDLAVLGPSLRIGRLEARLSGLRPVASVEALQPFEFNTETGELKVASPTGDLVGISIAGLPLAWIAPSIPQVGIAGDDAQGDFVVRAEAGRLALRTKAPLQAAAVSITRNGRRLASGLELSAFLLADYAPQGWQIQAAPFAVRAEGIRIVSLEARLGRLAGAGQVIKAAGSWSVDLPSLLGQPAASGVARLSSGDASGSFEASLDSTREVLLKVALRNLTLADRPDLSLPSVTSDIRADFGRNGQTAFSVPLHLDYGTRTADLAVAGTASTDPDGPVINAAVSGGRLGVGDLVVVSALVAPKGAEVADVPADAPGTPRPRPTAPFWPSARSRLTVKLAQVDLPRFSLRNIRSTVITTPGSLRVESATASLGDASVARLDGELRFSRADEEPYSFWASVAADNVDSAPLFRSIDPDRPAAIEGSFDVTAKLAGTASDPGQLLARATGEGKLSSRDGKFRALRTDIIETVKQSPSKLVDALDTVTSLFSRKTDKLGQALVESATGLSEIHYDQISLTAVRGADLNILVKQFTLIAPEERIAGTGSITYQSGVPIRAQPFSLDLDVGVRGRLGIVLGILGMLKEGGQDELGYSQLYQQVHLGGTLQDIDQSQWREMLVQAPLRKGSRLFDKLLGR
ncbi:MAG TPA: hypothetical protein VGF85_04740 [Opitutaceae bacterium]